MPCEAVSAASAPSCFPAAEEVKSWVTVCWKNAPMPAMPTAMPTCWKVSLMPDATPDLAGSVTPMARAARAGLKAPMPRPAMTSAGISTVQDESASVRRRHRMPIAMTRVEPPSRNRNGTLPMRPPPSAPATNIAPVSGRNRSPVPHASTCSMFSR